MTLLVRDSAGLLRENIEFHLGQGVNFFIITDNLSSDCTASIIQDYVRKGVAEASFESSDTYSQGRWVTRMARRAAELGADWVINNDDDEFWFAPGGTLRGILASMPETCSALSIERYNHPPVTNIDSQWFVSAMRLRERRSVNALGEPLPPKVCHRGFADVIVEQGNHAATRGGAALAALSCDAIEIAHYPVRDYPSFENKIAKGGAAYARNTELDGNVGGTWRHLYALWQAGRLRAWYDQQILTPDRIAADVAAGRLAENLTVLNALTRKGWE